MKETKPRPPMPFKLLDFGLPGKIAGSGQPGGTISSETIDSIMLKLNDGTPLENLEIPERLISNLTFLNTKFISVIYNLLPSPNPLAKYLWETIFQNTFITEITGVSTAIDSGSAPTQEQLHLITDDAIGRMSAGQNILFHCEGGLGRTGTALAAVYMKANIEIRDEVVIEYIRHHYSPYAIESGPQEEALEALGFNLLQAKIRSQETIQRGL